MSVERNIFHSIGDYVHPILRKFLAENGMSIHVCLRQEYVSVKQGKDGIQLFGGLFTAEAIDELASGGFRCAAYLLESVQLAMLERLKHAQ